ncbi:MAG: PAS domain S-box protein [bacterium]|nr:PAS domain S-box protein [bacterium]
MVITPKKIPKKAITDKMDTSFLAAIVQSSDDAILGVTLEGIVKSWNKGAEKMFGYTEKEIIGQPIIVLYPQELLQEHADIRLKIKNGLHIEHYETQRKKKDGTIIDVSLSISPIKDAVAEVIGSSEINRDISKEKRVAGYLRSLIEASVDPLVTISAEGKIMDVNEATIQVTGVVREKLIGTDFSDYFVKPEKARKVYKQVLSEGKVKDYPLSIRHVSGKITDVLYNASIYKDEKGNVFGVFAAARDITAQKQASEYARSLIEASLDPLITISTEGKVMDVNEATVKVTGVSRKKIIGSDFFDYFTDPEEARLGYQQVFKEGVVRDYPLTIKNPLGDVDVLYNATVYKDRLGNVLGAFAAARDVTLRKEAEEQLHETSAYARSLIEASVDPFITISPEGKITDVNEAMIQVTGVAREWIIGTDFSAYFTEPHKAQAGYRQVLKEGEVRDFPLSIHNASGKITDVSFNASVYKDAEGLVRGIFAVARDVTETKKLLYYARSLIEVSQDPLITISPEGKITDVNKAAIKVTGVTREVLVGSDFSNYFTDPQKAHEAYKQSFEHGFITDYSLTIKSKEGQLTDVLFNASVYKDEKGNVLGVTAIARDYTVAKKAKEETLSVNKELELFSSAVSHDLRAPLVAINGFSEMLVEDYAPKLDEEGKMMLSSIRQSTQLMGKLIDDLLAFSKAGIGEMTMNDVEMTAMVKTIFEELKSANPSRNIILNIAELPRTRVDSALMTQVWTNLISNAIKYTKNKKEAVIDVTFMTEKGEIIYAVKDNGVGFDMKYIDKLFTAFHRLYNQEEFEGTGIGLVTVKRIIERHSGRVWAEGKEGEGATFYFALPVTSQTTQTKKLS